MWLDYTRLQTHGEQFWRGRTGPEEPLQCNTNVARRPPPLPAVPRKKTIAFSKPKIWRSNSPNCDSFANEFKRRRQPAYSGDVKFNPTIVLQAGFQPDIRFSSTLEIASGVATLKYCAVTEGALYSDEFRFNTIS